jgi:hypothetical protein
MGQLEVTFRIGLAHPLLTTTAPSAPIVASFPETGNTVCIDAPDHEPLPSSNRSLGLSRGLLSASEESVRTRNGGTPAITEFRNLHILSDAAKVFWQFLRPFANPT